MKVKTSALCMLAAGTLLLGAPVAQAQDSEASAPAPRRTTTPRAIKGSAFPIQVIFTNIPGDPSAAVPGMPGVSFGPGTGTTHFDRIYGSPNGNWILSADTDLPAGSDEVILVNGTVMAVEGDPASWAAGENIGFIDTQLSINDSGDWVFATNTDGPTGADEYMVMVSGGTFTAVAQEGGASPLAGATWGSTIESGVITSGGTVGLVSDSLSGPPTTENEILVLGATILGQEGVTVPTGQLGSEFWDNFDLSDYHISADGSSWLAQGDLTGSTTSDDVVVVNGAVVVQEDVILPGSGFANPVDGSGIVGVHMDPAGNWFVRGNNDTTEQDWVYSNGAVVTSVGDPIFGGSAELWDDAAFGDCFFLHVGNSNGFFVIGGVTDNADPLLNGVLVLSNTTEIVREGDAIDLDGNGMFDDDTFFDTFGNDDAFLSDAGLLYIVATIKDGTDTRVGQGLLEIDLTSIVPVELTGFSVE